MTSGKNRLFVIGLDAADPDLLEQWVGQGELPFFERLMRQGTYCRLKCIPPTFSPVEWTSILTGANPGKHGIFGFTKSVDDGRAIKIINRTDRKCKTFYEILSEAGLRVGLINMVMTYPASPINGFMIGGMETPSLTSPDISYPAGLVDELRSIGCKYEISPGISGPVMQGKYAAAVEALHQAIDARYEATEHLMQKYNVDVMIVLFSQLDNCGHYFWRFHDPYHPDYDAEGGKQYGDVILKLYQKHELILQDLFDKNPDATYIICSDHGMGFNYEARYYLKELFARLGWFTSTDSASNGFSLKKLFSQEVRNLYWFLYRQLPMHLKQTIARHFSALRGRVEAIVDGAGQASSRIYSNDDFFSIIINQTDGEGKPRFSTRQAYLDFRDEIIGRLQALEELDAGKPLVAAVHTREDLYAGDFVEDAPDVVIEWADVRLHSGIRCGEMVIRPEEIHKNALQRILSGEHRPAGILLMKGRMLKTDTRIADGSVLDIAPTILQIAGQPVPRSMDGHVLTEAFQEAYLAQNPVEYTDVDQSAWSDEGAVYSAEEARVVEERLRGLGYID
jgi:predicted AlkP superfamily phosphohydrolase/phosphomutase